MFLARPDHGESGKSGNIYRGRDNRGQTEVSRKGRQIYFAGRVGELMMIQCGNRGPRFRTFLRRKDSEVKTKEVS